MLNGSPSRSSSDPPLSERVRFPVYEASDDTMAKSSANVSSIISWAAVLSTFILMVSKVTPVRRINRVKWKDKNITVYENTKQEKGWVNASD